ncbi:MAG: aldo/keto reductase, partial [Planctomycetales bacterium]|nr:aldo/keto reductase [Planctomycetales bacterium]
TASERATPIVVQPPTPIDSTRAACGVAGYAPLGARGPLVSRIGLSGHYGLEEEGFAAGVDAGINLFFWEPGYTTLSRFCQRLSPTVKAQLHFVAGSFKATRRGIRDDAHRALKWLGVERLSLYLMFWTRGWNRFSEEVIETLEQLEQAGDIGAFSLSTHNRELACEAMRGKDMCGARQRVWSPIMVRYSAAHRGAEQHVLPTALETGATVMTFNNTCYGRLLESAGDSPGASAADCYRFALAHPAVAVCWSAPANREQLNENLAAWRSPELSPEIRLALETHGARVYERDRTFTGLIRQR